MLMFRYFILLSLALAVLAKPLNYKKIIYAIDCGNNQAYKSQHGFIYQRDQGYSENTKVADYSTNSEIAAATIKYTYDQSVYMTERHADETFYYDIPVSTPGKYVLISKFSENWLKSPKTRMFDIKIGDCMGESKVDIYDRVGRFAAYDSYIEFELKNNNIYIAGVRCDGGYINGRARVYYVKIGYDNPKVDGIMLFQGELAETDYEDIPALRRDWDRKMKDEARRKEEERLRKEEARMKRRERVKPRNDEFEDFGGEYEETDYKYSKSKNIMDTIGDYLVLAIVLSVGGVIIYFLSTKGDFGANWFDAALSSNEQGLYKEERREKKSKATQPKEDKTTAKSKEEKGTTSGSTNKTKAKKN